MAASDKIAKIKSAAEADLNKVETTAQLTEFEVKYLGRKAELTGILRGVKDLPADQKAEVGKSANILRVDLEKHIEKRKAKLIAEEFGAKLKDETLDLTVTGQGNEVAKLHPLTKEREIIEDIFQRMGFQVMEPFLIDNDYNNFTALNIPEGHPARDMWDTIRVENDWALIPHTSAMQHRILSGQQVPIRAIVPGKCFRHEATDARHEHSFFQVEGVYVDRGIKLSDMLGTFSEFLKQYFGREVPIKIQPTYFPFVEPGLEVLMECPVCRGKKPTDCAGCSGSGWMEIIPCGPIHPFVLREAGLDPEVYSGFAWGFGLERLIMVKYQIDDIRYFHSGRLDFISQF
jgi:phenylalanyl-tRNA synthetase alpha chain